MNVPAQAFTYRHSPSIMDFVHPDKAPEKTMFYIVLPDDW